MGLKLTSVNMASVGLREVAEDTAPEWNSVLERRLPAPDSVNSYGGAVALSGDGNTAVVGALGDDVGATNSGSVYIFQKSGTEWEFWQKLPNPFPAASEFFGNDVVVSHTGEFIAISCYQDDGYRGSAYVYRNISGTYQRVAKLVRPGRAINEYFGRPIGISADGTTIAIGWSRWSSSRGLVYFYTWDGSAWSAGNGIVAAAGASGDSFGAAVALSGDGNIAVVAATGESVSGFAKAGAVRILSRNGTAWEEQEMLIAPVSRINLYFGNSIDISDDGNTIVVATYVNEQTGNYSGSVCVFTSNGTTWTLQQQLVKSDRSQNDYFGYAVALSGDGNTIAVTERDYGGPSALSGAIHVYVRTGETWSHKGILVAADSPYNLRMGTSISITADGGAIAAGNNYNSAPSVFAA